MTVSLDDLDAIKNLDYRCKIIAITSGGKLAKRCREEGVQIISAPSGKPPRTSVAYLFMPIVVVLKKLGIYESDSEIQMAIDKVHGGELLRAQESGVMFT